MYDAQQVDLYIIPASGGWGSNSATLIDCSQLRGSNAGISKLILNQDYIQSNVLNQ